MLEIVYRTLFDNTTSFHMYTRNSLNINRGMCDLRSQKIIYGGGADKIPFIYLLK